MAQAIIWDEHPDLALLGSGDRRGICCLVVQDADERQIKALMLPGAFCIYRQERQTALLYAQDLGFDGIPALEDALAALSLQGGLSGPFALSASARGCMSKAALALKTGRKEAPGRTLYPMDEYGEAALLAAARVALSAQGFSPMDFCDAALWQMARMDAQKETNYLESLDAYLSCGMDLKRAAQQLGVHRNTLAYRMERAQALFGLDLKDMNRCFELLFSLWIWHSMPDTQMKTALDGPYDGKKAQAALWRYMERCGEDAAAVFTDFPCAMLCTGVTHLPDGARAALLEALRSAAPRDAAFAFDEDVVIAVCPADGFDAFGERARTAGREAGCPMVVTQVFPSARIGQHARLCRMALCASQGALTRTRDIGSTLLFMAVERHTSLAPYLCEDVIRVMDDDAQKGTSLSRSLYAYLLHFRDLKRAAAQNGMHRNTMEYHIRKIDALIGSDMDGAKRFFMMCTYKMLALPDMGRYGT